MTNKKFRTIRKRLGITQAQLANILGYEMALSVSALERETNPRPIPQPIALLMTAYDEGYRPKNWPKE